MVGIEETSSGAAQARGGATAMSMLAMSVGQRITTLKLNRRYIKLTN